MLDLHREHGVSLFFALKRLLAVLTQIHVCIAAYHTLDENSALSHVGFLQIANLVEPDRLVLLLFAIPFIVLFHSIPAGMVLYCTSNNLARSHGTKFRAGSHGAATATGGSDSTRSGGELIAREEATAFRHRGFVVAPRLFEPVEIERISRWVDEFETFRERPRRHWMYFESSCRRPSERLLNRIENLAPFHTELAALLQGERLVGAGSTLIGELWSPLPAESLEAVELVLYPMEPGDVAHPPTANARLEKPARTASGSKRSRGSRPSSRRGLHWVTPHTHPGER